VTHAGKVSAYAVALVTRMSRTIERNGGDRIPDSDFISFMTVNISGRFINSR
jgi:hypothetical protein